MDVFHVCVCVCIAVLPLIPGPCAPLHLVQAADLRMKLSSLESGGSKGCKGYPFVKDAIFLSKNSKASWANHQGS
jgi:hypothetical protein